MKCLYLTPFGMLLVVLATGCSGTESEADSATDSGADTSTDDINQSDMSSSDVPQSDTSSEDTNSVGTSEAYLTCERSNYVGGFTLALTEEYTTIQGRVADGVDPISVSDVSMNSEGCEFLRPPQLFCSPGCTGGETCSTDGSCVTLPAHRDVGDVTIVGLGVEVVMSSRAPVYYYTFTGDLPHPAFSSSSLISLSTSGGDYAPFELAAPGVDALVTEMTSVAIESGSGAELTWEAGPEHEAVRLEIELNIANHGGTPARIECLVEDDGEFTIPAELVTALLENGFSGFPSLRMTRQGANAVTADPGCVELRLQSEVQLPVEIPGLVSCSSDDDCPDEGETCQGDLTCG